MVNYKLIIFIYIIISLASVFQPRSNFIICAARAPASSFEGVPMFRESLFLDSPVWV